jgi:hypothetical protein
MAADENYDNADSGIPKPTTTSHEDPMDDDAHDGEKKQFNVVLRVEFTIERTSEGKPKPFQAMQHYVLS